MTAFHCRACGAQRGKLVLDLGVQPLANNLLRAEDLDKPEPKFPLRVFVCQDCWLLQITDVVPPVQLFSEYFYFSSFSDTMLQHAKTAARRYIEDFGLTHRSLVVEIGSNDGYFLQYFRGIPCLGIEPAAPIAEVALDKGIVTVVDFFGERLANRLASENGKADLILGNNVFAHAPDINDFMRGLKALLKLEGRIVLEFPYAVDLIERTEFDTIYHEHVFYFSLTALLPLFAKHGLTIYDVERVPIHGGSLRLLAGHTGTQRIGGSVPCLLHEEKSKGVSSLSFYRYFSSGVVGIRDHLVRFLTREKALGKRIAAYGASAKGSTLLNYCQLGKGVIDFVADRSTYKQGRFTPGMHIPILYSGQLYDRQPDLTLLLTWNFAEEILEQQSGYREQGGQFVIPIPQLKVI